MDDSSNCLSTVTAEQLKELTPDHCSAVLQYFYRYPAKTATIDDLSVFIRDLDPPNGEDAHVAAHLHHATLPRLAANGFIDYDPRNNTARYCGRPQNDE